MCWTSEVLKAENSGESTIPIFKILRMYDNSKELAAYYRATPYVLYTDGKRIGFDGIYPYKAVVVKGYIPSNTRFYINEIGEIVTQRLILTNVLDI